MHGSKQFSVRAPEEFDIRARHPSPLVTVEAADHGLKLGGERRECWRSEESPDSSAVSPPSRRSGLPGGTRRDCGLVAVEAAEAGQRREECGQSRQRQESLRLHPGFTSF
jgi:hypothetical protein